MVYIIIAVILLIICLQRNKLLKKIKLFLKEYRMLIILQLVIIVSISLINVFDNSILVKILDPHHYIANLGYGVKEQYVLVEGETIKNFTIEEIKPNSVIISKNENFNEYKYGTGFSYYEPTSCACGTPVRFEKRFEGLIKLITFIVIITDVIIICLIKINKKEGEETCQN